MNGWIDTRMTRRRALALLAGASATLLLAACGDDDDDDAGAGVAGSDTTPTGAAAPPPPATTAPTSPPAATATAAPSGSPATDEAQVIVGDVVDYGLEPDGWAGPFGWVTLTLHRAHVDGEDVWHIRTDASDADFAAEHGLVFVPLLANALRAEGSYATLYRFTNGVEEQGCVITTTPTREDFTSAFRVGDVTFSGDPELLTSEADILAAADAGTLTVTETDIVVNYPLVAWPGGALPVDPDMLEPLGKGPLVAAPDLDAGTVTFKLHQCFPGSRYIVTDTSAVPMAPMMGVVGSAPTQLLKDASAVAPITIFLNGLAGPGVMGFQPAIFNTKAGDPAWSPFWDHYAAEWVDPAQARALTSQQELDAAVAAGEITLYNGVKDTHPNGFVVNCPAPILAANTYTGEG